MDNSTQIKQWISEDPMRMKALRTASELGLREWCLAAGFVRNLVWDKIHGYSCSTALNDVDLIYFDPVNVSEEQDRDLEQRLQAISEFPWSVKNQARMHHRNWDQPYASTEDAMSYWVEVETAVGATLNKTHDIAIVAPFGVDALFNYKISLNPKRPKPEVFIRRIQEKNWLEMWPQLVINDYSKS